MANEKVPLLQSMLIICLFCLLTTVLSQNSTSNFTYPIGYNPALNYSGLDLPTRFGNRFGAITLQPLNVSVGNASTKVADLQRSYNDSLDSTRKSLQANQTAYISQQTDITNATRTELYRVGNLTTSTSVQDAEKRALDNKKEIENQIVEGKRALKSAILKSLAGKAVPEVVASLPDPKA